MRVHTATCVCEFVFACQCVCRYVVGVYEGGLGHCYRGPPDTGRYLLLGMLSCGRGGSVATLNVRIIKARAHGGFIPNGLCV